MRKSEQKSVTPRTHYQHVHVLRTGLKMYQFKIIILHPQQKRFTSLTICLHISRTFLVRQNGVSTKFFQLIITEDSSNINGRFLLFSAYLVNARYIIQKSQSNINENFCCVVCLFVSSLSYVNNNQTDNIIWLSKTTSPVQQEVYLHCVIYWPCLMNPILLLY